MPNEVRAAGVPPGGVTGRAVDVGFRVRLAHSKRGPGRHREARDAECDPHFVFPAPQLWHSPVSWIYPGGLMKPTSTSST